MNKSSILKILILIPLIFSTCGHPVEKELTRDEIVLKNAEEYLQKRLNNPESYEFVELALIDSFLYIDNIERIRESFNRDIKFEEDRISFINRMRSFDRKYGESDLLKHRESIERYKRIINKIDSINNEMGERVNEVASYLYVYTFRATNAFGAKVIHSYYLQTKEAPDYEILQLTTEETQIQLSPNQFPGYFDIID